MSAKKKTWQQRRIDHLKAAVRDIENRPAGESVNKAIPRIAAKYNGRNLPGRKKVKLAEATLRRIWFDWKKHQSDLVFELHYPAPQNETAVQPWILELFARLACSQGIGISQAYATISEAQPEIPFTLRTLQRHLTAEHRAEIAESIAIRKKMESLDREIKSINERLGL